jgi:type II secretory pathway pseudopilin PulG
MSSQNRPSACLHGFILAELVVVVLVLGLAMIPIIRGMLMLPQVAAAISTQNRSESWRSLSDQAVTAGIDPIATPLLNAVSAQAVSGLQGKLLRTNLALRRGAPQITFLTETFSLSAESRSTGGGFEVGPGIAIPLRVDPIPPLPPITLGNPSLNPANGSRFALLSLVPPSTAGAPYNGNIRATGAAADFIRLRITAPSLRGSDAIGFSDISVSALELAQRVRGETWAEYNGNPATDIVTSLADGRMLWLVADKATGRIQPYEPSEKTDFVFGVSIGAPVYSVAGEEYVSGSAVSINFATALSIESRTVAATITYTQNVKDSFGNYWAEVEPSYNWHFGASSDATNGGNTVTLYQAAGRFLWQPTQTLATMPVTALAGLGVEGASWDLLQTVTALAAPDRVTGFYDESTSSDVSGNVDFRAPALDGTNPPKRMGRPVVDDLQSATDAVTIELKP